MEENIKELLKKAYKKLPSVNRPQEYYKFNFETEHDFFFNECLAYRKMKVNNINKKIDIIYTAQLNTALEKTYPLIYELTCLQCKSKAYLIVYKKEKEFKSVIIYEKAGGCSSKNAPEGVKYYLNQAYQARIIGAESASMSMYRAAMDFLLFDQGYTTGMLGKKIENLEEDINNKKAPKWAMEIDIDYIKAIKEIGNSSIHPNEGDIEKQKEIDQQLLNIVDIIFSELLDKIYEQPNRSKRNLEILYDKMKTLNK